MAKQRKLAIKKFAPIKLNQKQNLLLAIEEMWVYQQATVTAAEKRKATRDAAPTTAMAAAATPTATIASSKVAAWIQPSVGWHDVNTV